MRQYKLFVCFIQVILFHHVVHCGFERNSQPTIPFSMAFSGAAMFSAEHHWINPASVGRIATFQSSIFYSPSPFLLHQLSSYGLISAIPSELVNISLGVNSFGFSLYRESLLSVGAAKTFTNNLTIGLNTQFYHLSIDRYGTSTAAVLDIGAIYTLSDEVNLGLAIQNIGGASFGSDDEIPQSMISGISCHLYENILFNIDLVKDVRYKAFFRKGFSFSLFEIVTIRAGTEGSSSKLFGGIGLAVSSVNVHYGIASHTELGLIHSIGITLNH